MSANIMPAYQLEKGPRSAGKHPVGNNNVRLQIFWVIGSNKQRFGEFIVL
ncbi:hypothetical protein PIIN_07379 [Serendipita indica DSM 11827]|uniref:Uncharacterized protein n=1 Tax=Serendipita indica (strain DSM 11827) TaxID=1109443 RepID=G4TQ32_SERID|nr:hypothetical protein PIIN_07379 [Serendipita indica DSM 11827]